MTLFPLEERISGYGETCISSASEDNPGGVTLQQVAAELSLTTHEMVRSVCTVPSQGKELVSTVM